MAETSSMNAGDHGMKRPFEGREEALGKAVGLGIRTLKDAMPYQH